MKRESARTTNERDGKQKIDTTHKILLIGLKSEHNSLSIDGGTGEEGGFEIVT